MHGCTQMPRCGNGLQSDCQHSSHGCVLLYILDSLGHAGCRLALCDLVPVVTILLRQSRGGQQVWSPPSAASYGFVFEDLRDLSPVQLPLSCSITTDTALSSWPRWWDFLPLRRGAFLLDLFVAIEEGCAKTATGMSGVRLICACSSRSRRSAVRVVVVAEVE